MQHTAGLNREVSFVARALHAVVILLVIDGAGKVRAFLAVRDQLSIRLTHHDAGILLRGITEKLHASGRHIGRGCH